ncbi:hypothetical protein ACQP1W_26215 [Spirillospora sp. CA-255316]
MPELISRRTLEVTAAPGMAAAGAGRVLFGTARPVDSDREATLDTADLDRDPGPGCRTPQAGAWDETARLPLRPAGGRR